MQLIKQCNLDIVLEDRASRRHAGETSASRHAGETSRHAGETSASRHAVETSREIRRHRIPSRATRVSVSSDAESQPPVLHFADSPEPGQETEP
jgi:hypothetical protein